MATLHAPRMGPPTRKARIPALALVAVGAALLAATAVAGVTVYTNSFKNKTDFKEVKHAEGKHCKKKRRKKAEKFVVTASKGKTVCGYRPPVEGDGDAPDHYFQATEKLAKHTPERVRDHVYTGVAVRSANDVGYELWVFPSERKFRLARLDGGSQPTFLAKGKNKAINGVRKANRLGLKADGSEISAKVNGKRVAKTVDHNAGKVDGRKVELLLGYKKKRSKAVSMIVDDLKLQVPNP
jgi:hypothetical protein